MTCPMTRIWAAKNFGVDKQSAMNASKTLKRLQDLPSKAAHFCLGVERFCRDLPGLDLSGQTLLVAYSGGADSRALLFVLYYLAPRLGITIHAAILDHALRPEAADEVKDARAVCAGLGVPLHAHREDVAAFAREKGLGLEEAGRIARLRFLEDVRKDTGSAWIAMGHQLNDLAEDSVMRMVRGAGWPALAGMAAVSGEHHVLRPLLLTPRSELEAFLSAVGQTWHDDAMNEDDAYLRNRVRKYIIPRFLAENPSYLDGVAERWRMARTDEAFFRQQTEGLPTRSDGEGEFVSRDCLLECHSSVRQRKYMEILKRLGSGQAASALLHALDNAWLRNEGGKTVQFPGGKRAVILDGGIDFRKI